MRKCRNCPAMLPQDGPTRCPSCQRRNTNAEIARRSADPEKYRKKSKIFRDANRDRLNNERKSKYVSRAKTRPCLGCGIELQRKGPHRCAPCSAKHQAGYNSAKGKAWLAANQTENRAKSHRARIKSLGAEGTFSGEEWETLKAQYDNRCVSCRKQEPEINLEADHVLPLAVGGSGSIENIQPLCRSCNAKKRTKHIDYRKDFQS